VTWDTTHPSPEHELPLVAGWLPAALEAQSVSASRPHLGPQATVPQLTLTATIDAEELLLFRSDLRSSLEAVLVCAAGRALSTHPEVNFTVVERPGGAAVVPSAAPLVQLLVLCDDGLRTGTVDAGPTHAITDVRDAVASLVGALRCGRAPHPAEQAAVSLSTYALSGAAPTRTVVPPTSSTLTVGRLAGEPRSLEVGLSVDARVVDADQASRLFGTVLRLLEHPYRRLR
jgi:pyruvate/2-oxoglutarate dehydrogenase complex dihydrolipoamide acyltransferase (E2) component